MRDYNKDLEKINIALDSVNTRYNDGRISDEVYINQKAMLTNVYAHTLEKQQTQADIYASITNDDDKRKYNLANAIETGTVSKEDKSMSGGFLDTNNALINLMNEFFTLDDNVVDNRTISMGGGLYNDIIEYTKNNNINLKDFNIKTVAGNKEFIIPKDQKAFFKFAEIYHNCLESGLLNGTIRSVFSNTAAELFGSDGKIMDSRHLRAVGDIVYDLYNDRKEIEEKYGIQGYYMPIVSPTTVDFNYGINYVSGEKSSELNVINKDIDDRVLQANLLNYKVYANDADISGDNGGVGSLNEITDSKTKTDIMNAIFRESGDSSKTPKENTGNITYSFATSGYSYGTLIKIPKGDGFYEVYVEKLLPSEQAEQYVNSDHFQANALMQTLNAKANSNRISVNNLGSTYTGSFKGYGNDVYSYTINNGKEVKLNKTEATLLKEYSLVFNKLCIQNGFNSNNEESAHAKENIIKFMTSTDEVSTISFVNILKKVSNKSETEIINDLMFMYDNYYKK